MSTIAPMGREESAASLRQLLRFRQQEGQIWLGEHRMVLLHAQYLQQIRAELVATLGKARANGLLFRMGFSSGKADGALVRSLLPGASLDELIRLGPAIHGLEGLVVGSIETLHFDAAAGRFLAEASWQSSWESEVQLEHYGEAPEPSCYSQTGYASGYVTELTGRPIVFKEVACLSCGAGRCKIVGHSASEWGGDDPWVRLLAPEDVGLELMELREQVARLEEKLDRRRSQGKLIGASHRFYEALRLLEKAAPKQVSVLLLGETGVGKEAFARWVHANSARADKPFIAVNCGAIPEDLIESELFGTEAGAFTGAKAARPGRFERADGGTLFLDELGELSQSAQVKLLRVLQEGEIERLGASATRKVDIRLIAATNVDLSEAVAAKRFRADLFYRLNAFPVTIAPLRDRRADILPLAEAFLTQAQLQHGKLTSGLSDRAVRALIEHDWPGNVRELENVIGRGLLLADDGGEIGLESLGLAPIAGGADVVVNADGRLQAEADGSDCIDEALRQIGGIEDIERALIERALDRCGGNVSAASKLLGVSRATLDYRLRSRSIERPGRRRGAASEPSMGDV